MLHSTQKSISVVHIDAVIVPEHLFIEVTEQVERLDGDIRPLESALEQRPEVFKSVGVDLPIDVTFGMVNGLVNEVLIVESLIGQESIGINRTVRLDVRSDMPLQDVLAARGDDIRSDLTSTLQNAHDRSLVLYAAFGNFLTAFTCVHEASGATDESFINFYFDALP